MVVPSVCMRANYATPPQCSQAAVWLVFGLPLSVTNGSLFENICVIIRVISLNDVINIQWRQFRRG